jgi:hypothetical protein
VGRLSLPEVVFVSHGRRGHGHLVSVLLTSLESSEDGIQTVDPSEAIALQGHHTLSCDSQWREKKEIGGREDGSLKMKREPKKLTIVKITPWPMRYSENLKRCEMSERERGGRVEWNSTDNEDDRNCGEPKCIFLDLLHAPHSYDERGRVRDKRIKP